MFFFSFLFLVLRRIDSHSEAHINFYIPTCEMKKQIWRSFSDGYVWGKKQLT